MSDTLKAVGRWLLIEVDKKSLKTDGGLFLSDVHTMPEGTGRVIYAGRGHYNKKGNFVETPVKEGDRVAFKWFDAQQLHRRIKWEGKDLVAMKDDEIVGVVEQEVAA